MSSKLRTAVNESGETVIVMRRIPVEVDAGIMLALIERLGLSGPLLEICRNHHVLLEHVLVGMRSRHVTMARAECCLHLRELGMSYPEIAKVLGMDPSSPLYAVRRARERKKERGSGGEGSTT